MGDLRQNVLVTGASSGIGKMTARLFAAKGFRKFGTSRSSYPDEDGVEMLVPDVTSDGSVHRCVEGGLTRAGHEDVLVNNAGVWQVSIAEATLIATARAIFETNFFGVVRMTYAVLPAMRKRGSDRIIDVGSLATWVVEPGEAFHSTSKKALSGYSEALGYEVWPPDNHVSLVEPGPFRTNPADTLSATEDTIDDYDAVRKSIRNTLGRALEKGGDPQRVAELMPNVARSRAPAFRYRAEAAQSGCHF